MSTTTAELQGLLVQHHIHVEDETALVWVMMLNQIARQSRFPWFQWLIAGLLMWPTAMAGTVQEVQQVYFSPNGKAVLVAYQAFNDAASIDEQYLTVLETTQGIPLWTTRLEHYVEDIEKPLPQTFLLDLYWKTLSSRYGFKTTLRPKTVYWRKHDGLKDPPPLGPEGGAAAGQFVKYPLKLWTANVTLKLNVRKETPPSRCPLYDPRNGDDPPANLQLVLTGADGRQRIIPTLTTLTPPDPCTYAYGLKRVDVQGNRVLFTVAGYSPGLEGPDVRLYFFAMTAP